MEHLIKLTNKQSEYVFEALNGTDYTIEELIMLGATHAIDHASKHVYTGNIGNFVNNYCIVNEAFFVPVVDFKTRLYDVMGSRVSQKLISSYMQARGFRASRVVVNGKQVRSWRGLRLKND